MITSKRWGFLFSTKSLVFEEFLSPSDSALPLTVNELCAFYRDPDFAESSRIEVVITPEEVQKLSLVYFFVTVDDLTYLRRMANWLNIRLTTKDHKVGVKRIRARLVQAMENPKTTQRVLLYLRRTQIPGPVLDVLKNQIISENETWDDLVSKVLQSRFGGSSSEETKERLEAVAEESVVNKNLDLSKEQIYDHVVMATMWSKIVLLQSDAMQYWQEVLWKKPQGVSFLTRFFEEALNEWLDIMSYRSGTPSPEEEIRQLKAAKAALAEDYERDVLALERALAVHHEKKMGAKTSEEESFSSSDELDFRGRRILIVGDDGHKATYRELVELYGGEFDFVSGFQKEAQAIGRIKAADGIVMVTAFMNHSKWYALRANVAMEKVVLVPRAGLTAVDQGLRELARRWQISVSA